MYGKMLVKISGGVVLIECYDMILAPISMRQGQRKPSFCFGSLKAY